jgi:hypothetical protein
MSNNLVALNNYYRFISALPNTLKENLTPNEYLNVMNVLYNSHKLATKKYNLHRNDHAFNKILTKNMHIFQKNINDENASKLSTIYEIKVDESIKANKLLIIPNSPKNTLEIAQNKFDKIALDKFIKNNENEKEKEKEQENFNKKFAQIKKSSSVELNLIKFKHTYNKLNEVLNLIAKNCIVNKNNNYIDIYRNFNFNELFIINSVIDTEISNNEYKVLGGCCYLNKYNKTKGTIYLYFDEVNLGWEFWIDNMNNLNLSEK